MDATHALASLPLDGSLLLHQFPEFHLLHNPNHVIYTWKDADAEKIHELTHLEFCRAVHRAADAVKHLDRSQPVGVLALCDTILYHAVFLGLMKAGYVVCVMASQRGSLLISSARHISCRPGTLPQPPPNCSGMSVAVKFSLAR